MREVRGKTLRLYWYLEKPGGLTMFEIQLKRGFKNRSELDPALAKLKRLSLVRRDDEGHYYIPPKIADKGSFLFRSFIPVGNLAIPYSFISAVLYSVFLLGSLIATPELGRTYVMVIGLVMSFVFWIWAGYTWSRRPFK